MRSFYLVNPNCVTSTQIKIVRNITELLGFKFVLYQDSAELDDTVYSQLQIAKNNVSKPSLYIPDKKIFISLQDSWEFMCKSNPEMIDEWNRKLSEGMSELPVSVQHMVTGLEIAGTGGFALKEITFQAKITRDVSYISPSRAVRYQEGGKLLADLVSFEKKIGDQTIYIDISKTSEGTVMNVTSSISATINIITIKEDEDTKK